MDKKDFSDLEDQIRNTVKNTLNAIDFASLKKDIGAKAENTLNNVKTDLNSKSQLFNAKMEDKTKNRNRNKNEIKRYICKSPVGSTSGILYTIAGFVGSTLLGFLLILYSIGIYFFSGFLINSLFYFGILLTFFVSSIILSLRGGNLRNRVKRFKRYASLLDGQNYCSIEELAIAVKKKNKYVVKDLRKMIDLDMFREAHIDEKQTYFMLSNEVYDNYLKSQEALKQRNDEEFKRREKSNEEINNPGERELRQIIDMGKNYIEQIKSVNDAISEEEISNKLDRLKNIVTQILDYVEDNPKKLSAVNKFTNHYLPITLKLVNLYKELNEQPVQGANIKSAKNEIKNSIDIINIAFEKLLDDLFEEIALDISTDISVLETLFTQDGLTKKDFEK